MSGENESLPSDSQTNQTPQKLLRSLKNKVEEYERKHGLPAADAEETENQYINLTANDLRSWTAEECGVVAGDLAAFAIRIQRILNKENAYLHWIESNINRAIATELNDYAGYYSTEQRRAVAVANNEYAKALEDMRITSQVKVDCLSGLPYQLNQLCKMISEIHQTKRR